MEKVQESPTDEGIGGICPMKAIPHPNVGLKKLSPRENIPLQECPQTGDRTDRMDRLDRLDSLHKIHAHSSAETSGLGDSLQRIHTLSSTETSGYGDTVPSPTFDHSPLDPMHGIPVNPRPSRSMLHIGNQGGVGGVGAAHDEGHSPGGKPLLSVRLKSASLDDDRYSPSKIHHMYPRTMNPNPNMGTKRHGYHNPGGYLEGGMMGLHREPRRAPPVRQVSEDQDRRRRPPSRQASEEQLPAHSRTLSRHSLTEKDRDHGSRTHSRMSDKDRDVWEGKKDRDRDMWTGKKDRDRERDTWDARKDRERSRDRDLGGEGARDSPGRHGAQGELFARMPTRPIRQHSEEDVIPRRRRPSGTIMTPSGTMHHHKGILYHRSDGNLAISGSDRGGYDPADRTYPYHRRDDYPDWDDQESPQGATGGDDHGRERRRGSLTRRPSSSAEVRGRHYRDEPRHGHRQYGGASSPPTRDRPFPIEHPGSKDPERVRPETYKDGDVGGRVVPHPHHHHPHHHHHTPRQHDPINTPGSRDSPPFPNMDPHRNPASYVHRPSRHPSHDGLAENAVTDKANAGLLVGESPSGSHHAPVVITQPGDMHQQHHRGQSMHEYSSGTHQPPPAVPSTSYGLTHSPHHHHHHHTVTTSRRSSQPELHSPPDRRTHPPRRVTTPPTSSSQPVFELVQQPGGSKSKSSSKSHHHRDNKKMTKAHKNSSAAIDAGIDLTLYKKPTVSSPGEPGTDAGNNNEIIMGVSDSRRGSYTPTDTPSLSRRGSFLGAHSRSTWLTWSQERRNSFKRRLDVLEQRQKEMEKTRVSTPVRKARKESVMFVSPELESKHVLEDEVDIHGLHSSAEVGGGGSSYPPQAEKTVTIPVSSKRRRFDKEDVKLTQAQWNGLVAFWEHTTFVRCRYGGTVFSLLALVLTICSISNQDWFRQTATEFTGAIHSGLWLECSTTETGANNCTRLNGKNWQNAVIGLLLFAIAFGFLATILSVCGVCTTTLPKKIYYYHSAGEIYFICALSTMAALIIYPVAIESEKKMAEHQYGAGYGLGWGAAFFFFAAAMCMCLDDLVRTIAKGPCFSKKDESRQSRI